MATAARVAASPSKTRKGRTVPAVQPSTILINSSNTEDSLSHRQTQRLVDRFGLTIARARLVADLAWGDSAHG